MSGGERLRASQHSGRQGSAKHNDRSFLAGRSEAWRQEHAPHIDPERTDDNVVWTWDGQTDVEASERAWYSQEYQRAQDATNARYASEGHSDRRKSTDQLYEGRLTRPEEMILQVGTQTDGIDPAEFAQAVDRYLDKLDEWDTAHGGHMHILSIALHVDESSPHLHIRRVWDYTDRDGLTRLGQAKALEAAGIELPNPGKPVGRYNNRKITFDAMARGWWQEACREQGWEIETEARPGMRHKEKRDYIYDQMTAELDTARQERDAMTAEADTARQEATRADKIRHGAQQRAQEARQQAQETEARLTTARTKLEAIEERTRILTEAEVERMRQSHRGFFGLRLVRADDWERVMDTARQAEDATRRANTIEQERDAILKQAQEQAAELTQQATQERDKAVQERDKARQQRDGLRRERDAIAKDAQEWIERASGDRGVYLTGYLKTERMASKLVALMEYQEGWMLKSLDETMDKYISSIPAPMMPDSMREMLKEFREQDSELEAHERAVKDLSDDLEL